MTDVIAPPRNILVVLGAEADGAALEAAIALADHHAAVLEILTCVQPPHDLGFLAKLAGRSPEGMLDDLRERRREEIAQLLAEKAPQRSLPVNLRTGKPFVEVIRFVLASSVDFVIKTAEPLGSVRRFLFGSTDQHLLRKCPCPVWLVGPNGQSKPRTVLAAIDLDEEDAAEPETLASLNRRVIAAALNLAGPGEAEVFVLHSWDAVAEGLAWAFSTTGEAQSAAERYTREIREKRRRAMDLLLAEFAPSEAAPQGRKIIPRLVKGSPERMIAEQVGKLAADVLVMGTVARTGLEGVIIGNTAENIINSVECPVLAVKPDGFESPISLDGQTDRRQTGPSAH